MPNIKKKIAVLVVAVFCLAVLLFGLTACNPHSDNGGNGDDAPKYSAASIDIVLADRIAVGKTAAISASASAKTSAGKYVTSAEGFTYESGDTSVATVGADGTVTGVAEGSADITVRHAEFGAEGKRTVTVVDKVTLDLNAQTGINVFGRVRSRDGGLLLVNAASGFEAVFDGADLTASVSADKADKLYIVCDGKTAYVDIAVGVSSVALAQGLSGGLHTLRAYKATDETSAVAVKALTAADGASFYASEARTDTKISVYGDGAVLGDGIGGVTNGYAFSVANKLGAEFDVMALPTAAAAIAADGEKPVKDVWNKYSIESETNYVSERKSDLILIDLGTNDVRAIAGGKGTVADFVDGYRSMLSAMRAADGNANIICCYGMTTESASVGKYIKRIVKQANNDGDPKIFALDMVRCDGKALGQDGKPNALGQSENADLLAETLGRMANGQSPTLRYDAAKPDISVVLLGGQSNMEGNAHHVYLQSDPCYAEYVAGYDGIKMSYVNHEDDADAAPDFQKVRIGYGGAERSAKHVRSRPRHGKDLARRRLRRQGRVYQVRDRRYELLSARRQRQDVARRLGQAVQRSCDLCRRMPRRAVRNVQRNVGRSVLDAGRVGHRVEEGGGRLRQQFAGICRRAAQGVCRV